MLLQVDAFEDDVVCGHHAHQAAPRCMFEGCVPAARLVAGPDLGERRRIVGAMGVGERAARREAAALRHQLGRRHGAADRREPPLAAAERRHGAHEADGVGMLRILEDRLDRPALDDPAGIHHRDLVGDFRHDAEIVRDEDHGRAGLLLQSADEGEDLRLDRHVERRRRLVGDQKLRVVGERHGDHHALAHAAGHLVRIGAQALLGRGNAHLLEHVERPLPGLGLARPCDAGRCPRRSGRRW